ncbi:MAG: hypothetical protein PHC68_03045 [Syntrophorhabdaceae bacterium]|nr:hypothetical protein [Syntrophorhabdaceae bacterium]
MELKKQGLQRVISFSLETGYPSASFFPRISGGEIRKTKTRIRDTANQTRR